MMVCNEVGNEVDIRTVPGVQANGSRLNKIRSHGEKIHDGEWGYTPLAYAQITAPAALGIVLMSVKAACKHAKCTSICHWL